MKRLIFIFAILLACALAAGAAPPAPLTTMHAVHAVSNAQASLSPPVAFEATVTYFNPWTHKMTVQDGDEAIYVRTTTNDRLFIGERVLVKGTMEPSFIPIVVSDSFTPLGKGEMPEPVPATFDQLISKTINCRYVHLRGVVRTADLLRGSTEASSRLRVLMDGGYIIVEADTHDDAALKDLLDAEVEITGVTMRVFDGKNQ